jgi:hypothetical protein
VTTPVGGPQAKQHTARNLLAGLHRHWRRHRLVGLAILALAALALGFYGFLFESHESPLNALYSTLSLLAFSYQEPHSGTTPTLQIARFMAPAVTAFATFTALTKLLQEQWQVIRARRHRGHIVVCGLGQRGLRLVRSLREQLPPRAVVAIEADPANPHIETARRLGAFVVVGDASDPETLSDAGTKRATTLISLCAEDATNAAVASVARELSTGRNGGLSAYCHAGDADLVEHLTGVGIAAASEKFSLEWFSIPERAARLLLEEAALSRRVVSRDAHLIVVGSDDLARSIVVNASRQWHSLTGSGGTPLRITIADAGARGWISEIVDRFPLVAQTVELVAYERDLRSTTHLHEARQVFEDAAAVFVCASTDTESLEIAFALTQVVDRHEIVIVRLLVESEGFANLLTAAESSTGAVAADDEMEGIRVFNIIDRTCTAAMITDGLVETLARALHTIYIHQPTYSSDVGRPLGPYEKLPDGFKESNRAQARHVAAKLHRFGWGVRPLMAWNDSLHAFSKEQVDELAQLENERWNKERHAQNWKWGPKTIREQKIHELLDVPWDDLPEEAREYDREFVRQLPRVLADAGYEIHPPD